jgi:hypothetical protein
VSDYGYLHLGRVVSYNPETGGYFLRSVGLARASKWGPVESCVPGLLVDDRVVLAAVGTTRDDLKIIAKVGATVPDISDIPGLVAALNAKADDSEITTINGTLTTHASAITALGGRATALENRATTVENRATALENDLLTFHKASRLWAPSIENELFGDKLSSVSRLVTNGTTAINGATSTRVMLLGFAQPGESYTGFRTHVAVAGAGGNTCDFGVFWGNDFASMTRVANGSFSVAAAGLVQVAFSGGPIVAPGTGPTYVAALMTSTSAAATYASIGIQTPMGLVGVSGPRLIGFNADTAVPAGPINLGTAGPYSASSARLWMALY